MGTPETSAWGPSLAGEGEPRVPTSYRSPARHPRPAGLFVARMICLPKLERAGTTRVGRARDVLCSSKVVPGSPAMHHRGGAFAWLRLAAHALLDPAPRTPTVAKTTTAKLDLHSPAAPDTCAAARTEVSPHTRATAGSEIPTAIAALGRSLRN